MLSDALGGGRIEIRNHEIGMTSSARGSDDCGIVRPSALAVLRLMTSSRIKSTSLPPSGRFVVPVTLPPGRGRRHGNDDVELARRGFAREFGQSLPVSVGIACVDQDRLAVDVAKLSETLTEHGNRTLGVSIFRIAENQHADARNSRLRLPPGTSFTDKQSSRPNPAHNGASCRHWITSSVDGSPAVLRFDGAATPDREHPVPADATLGFGLRPNATR